MNNTGQDYAPRQEAKFSQGAVLTNHFQIVGTQCSVLDRLTSILGKSLTNDTSSQTVLLREHGG